MDKETNLSYLRELRENLRGFPSFKSPYCTNEEIKYLATQVTQLIGVVERIVREVSDGKGR